MTLEEALRGALAYLRAQRGKLGELAAYDQLLKLHRALTPLNILPFDEGAQSCLLQIPERVRRRHPQDCRIAAIAISRSYAVVTCNTRHFELIPGVRIEDWTL